jgi:hypothetical protein
MELESGVTLKDIINWGFALAGFGFSAWAYFLKRMITIMDKLGLTLENHSDRIKALESSHYHLKEDLARLWEDAKEKYKHERST